MDDRIEADDGLDAHSIPDSGYDDTLCSTDSLRSSVFAYEQENGRTYHAFHAGKYHVPNDEGEQERMDIHYHALRLSIEDKLFHAPVKELNGVLDVGAGTGIWAMDVADTYPAAQVLGFDLSPIQPTSVPPNLTFEVHDADETWDYGANRFDLVHTRFMNGFSIKSWDHFYTEAFKCMKPGAWVENQELDVQVRSDDGTIPANSHVQEWIRLWNVGMEAVGMTGRCYPEILAEKMRNAGFINVEVKHYKMPIGAWPKNPMLKEAGVYGLVAIIEGMQGLSIRIFNKILGWSLEELEVFLAHVRAEFKRKSIHSYWPTYIIFAQKPFEAPTDTHTSSEAVEPMEVVDDSTQTEQNAPVQHINPPTENTRTETESLPAPEEPVAAAEPHTAPDDVPDKATTSVISSGTDDSNPAPAAAPSPSSSTTKQQTD